MFWTIVYFLVAYGAVAWILRIILGDLPITEDRRRRVIVLSFLLSAPLLPYVWIWALTIAFGNVLKPAVQASLDADHGAHTPILKYRVMSVRPSAATVYVVVPCSRVDGLRGQSGLTVGLTKEDGKWTSNAPSEAVWTDCGSLDGNTFPPFLEGF